MRVSREKLAALAQSKERRRFRRVRVDLAGRYMLADGRESTPARLLTCLPAVWR
jgi:hypothetical protein